jgi:prepilin-type processing-associated H-X9-DG protein/prepilin-type N-terminal cleavage/methylation domain-containing protein
MSRKPGHGGCRAGFTIVELLTCLFIIGLLLALILPAVQASRETSRRMTCRNHLHQFGLALHSFESAHQEFPKSGGPIIHRAGLRDLAKGYSVHAQLLPWFDLVRVYDRIDFSRAVNGEYHALESPTLDLAERVALFQCPSDGGAYGTNYRACAGPGPQDVGSPDHHGLFGPRWLPARTADLTDGASNTVAMSEKLLGGGRPGTFDPRRDYWHLNINQTLSSWDVPADDVRRWCQTTSTAVPAYPYAGYLWMVDGMEYTEYNHLSPPNGRDLDCSGAGGLPVQGGVAYAWSNTGSLGGFRASSAHGGGVNVLYADGAVKLIADDVDLQVWRSAATARFGD